MKYLTLILSMLLVSIAAYGEPGRRLHAPPAVIGNIAAATGAKKLVLNHFMARSLDNLQQNLDVIRSRYTGPLVSSNDLECIEF